MRAAERQAGAGWGAPVVIGAPDEPGLLGSEIWSPATQQVTLDARDDATVVWNSEKTGRAQYALRFGVNAGWQAARPLASESLPELAVDASGIVTAVWTGGSTAAGPVVVATRGARARGWSAPRVIPGSGRAWLPWLSVNDSGRTVVVWNDLGGSERVVTRTGSRGAWTAPVSIGRGGFPQAAVDRHGDAAVIWQRVLSRPTDGWQIDAAVFGAPES